MYTQPTLWGASPDTIVCSAQNVSTVALFKFMECFIYHRISKGLNYLIYERTPVSSQQLQYPQPIVPKYASHMTPCFCLIGAFIHIDSDRLKQGKGKEVELQAKRKKECD